MPLLLEIVTPERLAYSDTVDSVHLPGIEGELGVLPHHAPLVSMLGVGELRIRKGGAEESFAIVGGFLQVRPDRVVVMAETADLASEIDLEKAQEARREAERALEGAARRMRSTSPPPEPSSSRHSSGSASPSAATARARGTAADAAQRRMADAKPFHWEYHPEPVAREVFRVEGGRPLSGTVPISGAKNAALKLLAAATLTGERCRFTNVPEIEDVRVMAETLRDLGVVVDHPADNVYEVASGDVEWLFVPLEAAARMRASFMLLGPLLTRFGRVIISNPGGDRIGRRPVDLHVEAMRALGASIEYRNGYYFATSPGPPARRRGPLPVRVGDGHRERDARRDPRRGPHGHPAGRPGARGRRPDRVPPGDGRGRRADLPRHDRDRGPQAPPRRRAPGHPRPDRGRHVHRRRRRDRRQGHAPGRPVRPPRARSSRRWAGSASASAAAPTRSRSTAPPSTPAATRRRDIETAPYPGLATDLQPPTVRAAHPGDGRLARPRGDLRGPPRVARRGPPDGRRRRDARRPPRDDHRPGRARRGRGRDRRPARRRLADPGRPGGRGHDHHPRCAPRSPGL